MAIDNDDEVDGNCFIIKTDEHYHVVRSVKKYPVRIDTDSMIDSETRDSRQDFLKRVEGWFKDHPHHAAIELTEKECAESSGHRLTRP